MSSSGEPKFEPLFEDEAPAPSVETAVPAPSPTIELGPPPPLAETPAEFPNFEAPPVDASPVESSFAPPTAPAVESILPPFAETQASEAPTFNTVSTDAGPPTTSALAEFPFHVRIDGPLAEHEKAKLIAILDGDDFGVRSIDIEPQIAAGSSILLPRMSRYATAYLLQNLPLTEATIKVQLVEDAFAEEPPVARVRTLKEEVHHPADDLPLTQAETFPQFPGAEVFDFVTFTLTAPANDTAEPFERLKRKLRFVAHGKGAQGITRYRQESAPTMDPAFVRLSVSGDFVRIP